MKLVVLAGRILFSLIFIISGFGHFKEQTIQYAASNGVIMPNLAVPVSGIIAMLGGLSIAVGYKTKFGAWLIVLFLVPVTLGMHDFWSISDSYEHKIQVNMFMKNLSMLGGALLIAFFGAGPLSIDNNRNVKKTNTP